MNASIQREREIFVAAVGKVPPEQWEAYLQEACAGDDKLLHRLKRLLQAHMDAGSVLDGPAPSPIATVDDPITERPGTVIGPYKLMEQIGEGGFGVVFLAEQQQPVRRKVALKVLKPGMDTRQVVARFEAERQALALMDHPNIARVFDGGATDSGRPYFVMELVKGIAITDYCDQNQLTPRERLELFLPVCQAVQHAHQKGIIHRDLKPSNVLVTLYDGTPVPKVIDFGIAKAMGQQLTDKTLCTGFAQLVGTPLYMSPEQAALSAVDVDTRSDIYALGVLLYELLTGTTPFDSERLKEVGYDELRRIIREEEPPKPSTRISTLGQAATTVSTRRKSDPKRLSQLFRGELDWIVMKCLEKDRNRRYETASGLARDIERYLHDEPVQACPPSRWYRLRKFLRRHKVPVLAASVVLLALLAGMIGTTLGLLRAERARQVAEEKEREAKEQAAITQAVNGFLQKDLLGQADIANQLRAEERNPRVTVRELLDRAAQQIEGKFPQQELTEAAIRRTIGSAYGALGEYPEAEKHLGRALQLRTSQLGPDAPETLRSMNDLAESYRLAGRAQEALKLHEETVQIRKAKLGPDHPETLRSMNNLAVSYAAAGRTQDALELHEETLQLYKAKLGPDHRDTLISMGNLADSYHLAGRTQEALKLHEETLRLKKAKLGPDHPETLASMHNLADSYAVAGRTQEALKLNEETLQLCTAKLGPHHAGTLQSMCNLANSYETAGRTQEALKLREETLQLCKAKLGPEHPVTLTSMHNLAISCETAGRTQEALELTEETLQLRKAKLGPSHPDTLRTMNNLAASYAAVGRAQEALKLKEETLQLCKAKLGPDHPDTLVFMNNLAGAYITAGEPAKALAILQNTLALREQRAKAEPGTSLAQSFLAWTHGQIGEAEQARLEYAAAVQAYVRSVQMFEKLDQAGALRHPFRGWMSDYRQRLALCSKAEQAVKDLDFALKQPAEQVPGLLDLRVRFLLKEQKLPAAVESAAKMKELAGDKAAQLYDAVCAYALCAGEPGRVSAGSKLRGADAAPLAKKCAEEAMALLKQAVAKGYKDAAHMKQDIDLDALRDREDFKKLVTELEAKAKEPGIKNQESDKQPMQN
jgi:serine/threonine protein kinase